ncbi:MAG: hypothetical protein OXT68_09060 [Chloroflexota bacterium]|nr:hypothetical protein [Chloroflexota bacterium]
MDAPTRTVFDVVTDFLASRPTDEEMLAYRIPADQQARLDSLIETDATSRLTAAQREELGDFRFVADVLTLLRAKIRRRLVQENGDNCGEASAEGGSEASSADADKQEENGS